MPTPTPPPRIIAGYEPGARKYYLTVQSNTPLIEVEILFRRGYKLSTTLATAVTDTLTKSRLA